MNDVIPAREPPTLRPARLNDYENIQQLGLTFSLDLPAEEGWRKLWLDNPLRARFGDNLPLGWVLETQSGEMVGTMGTVLVPYTLRGEQLISAVSRAWFVKPQYRSFALLLMDEYLNQPHVDLFINNAVSVPALESFNRYCERIPVGQWESMSYWVTEPQGFARRVFELRRIPFARWLAYPAGAGLRLRDSSWKHLLPKNVGAFTIEANDGLDERFDVFWSELVAQNPEKLLAERSSRVLRWHFGAPMRKGRLWVLTACRNGKLFAYCTLTRQDHAFRLPALPHNDRQGITAMRLVDYQCIDPELELLAPLLAAALERCCKDGIHILENLGLGVPKMRALDNCAPYHKKLSNWKFFYSAADPRLAAELHAERFWDPSAYDGDASFE